MSYLFLSGLLLLGSSVLSLAWTASVKTVPQASVRISWFALELRLLHTENLSVSDFHIIQEDTGTEGTIAAMTIKMDKQANKDAFLDQVRQLDSVEFITVNYPR